MKQQSFKNNEPTLYLVATPIGNLEEMTPRAIEILKTVDVVAAEDTRNARKLFSHFGIETKLISHHAHNEKASSQGILELFETHKSIALISDAGYPLISDPGQTLVSDVLEKGFNVVPVSGPSAFLNALVGSGLVAQPFSFIGFLEHKESALRKQLTQYKDLPMTTIYYVSVHKLEPTLQTILDVLGDRKICLVRELTKLHEEWIRGTVSEVIESLDVIKGEFVLVIEKDVEEKVISISDLMPYVDEEIASGKSVSRAIASVAKTYNVSKNDVYAYYHEKK